uniref:Uncharacterized protein n=1 Tax=uncultured prokaryote TaxID=198431 RepID=A0A0H5Q5E2_9ZZZZ|nr:hypothetical protein [uncultured prokaryote]
MPHPIYGKPSHQLEVLKFSLHLPNRRNGWLTRLEASGECSTKRASLWSISETWTVAEQDSGLQPTDALHHIALLGIQDHPASQEAVFRALTGEPWVQEVLPGF